MVHLLQAWEMELISNPAFPAGRAHSGSQCPQALLSCARKRRHRPFNLVLSREAQEVGSSCCPEIAHRGGVRPQSPSQRPPHHRSLLLMATEAPGPPSVQ